MVRCFDKVIRLCGAVYAEVFWLSKLNLLISLGIGTGFGRASADITPLKKWFENQKEELVCRAKDFGSEVLIGRIILGLED